MTRKETRALLKSALDALSVVILFNSGRITEFNSQRDNEYPFVWSDPLSRATEFRVPDNLPLDGWNVSLHFAKKDQAGSSPEEYESIVDDCDLLAKQFTNKLNSVIEGFKLITITNLSCDPFYHRHADDTSGVVLSFILNSPDQTNVC